MNIVQIIKNLYAQRYGRWLLHLLFWLFMFAARCYINFISINPYKEYTAGVLLGSLYATITTAIAYYLLVYIIYAQLLKHKKYAVGIAAIILLIVLYTFLDYSTEMLLLQDVTWRNIAQQYNPAIYAYLQQNISTIMMQRVLTLGIVYQLFLVLSLPLFIKVVLAYTGSRLQAAELARQNVQLEFNFLKAQVNPHFLFNTLNNIYSLILHDKKEQSADTVARLSAFMRYSLYDAAADKIHLTREIKLMNDYIELEKLRLNHIQVQTHFAANETHYQLPPLLLMPLLENAFKYCADVSGAFIHINMHTAVNRLSFTCSNSYNAFNNGSQKGGIGTENVQRRLAQYYPGKFSYVVTKEDAVYSVNLSIDL